ncbi:MAG: SRPBCC domain-containing protein [Tenuifilaceae bacterium]
MNQSNKPIVVELTFSSSISQVWSAITRLEEMRQWFFNNIPAFEPVVGFETDFSVQSESRNFHHLWRIIEVESNKKIKYHWSYKGYKGEGFVTFELFEVKEQTLLRLTNEGLETFPKDIPEFKRESCQAGWEFFIKQNLKTYLEHK